MQTFEVAIASLAYFLACFCLCGHNNASVNFENKDSCLIIIHNILNTTVFLYPPSFRQITMPSSEHKFELLRIQKKDYFFSVIVLI